MTKDLRTLVATCVLAFTSNSTAAAPDAAPEQAERIVVLIINVQGDQHTIIDAQVVSSPVRLKPSSPDQAPLDAIEYSTTDSSGNVVISGWLSDPRVVRSPMSVPGEATAGHEIVILESSVYIIRFPYAASIRYLSLKAGKMSPAVQAKQTTSSTAGIQKVQVIDLAGYLAK